MADAPARIRSFVAMLLLSNDAPVAWQPTLLAGDTLERWISIERGRLRLWLRPREAPDGDASTFVNELGPVLLGDDAECRTRSGPTSLVNAATISCDPARSSLTIHTSIVGLPPVFLYTDGRRAILASDVYLIAGVPGVHLELDPTGVAELARIGHPVGHRTLFKNTQRLPSGTRVVASRHTGVTIERSWRLPDATPIGWDRFLDLQIATFTDAIRRLDVSRSFLSLTAGLDTRTVFAALASRNHRVPAATMSGARPSLDARTAARLCRAYGVPHTLVAMDDRFARNLPDYVQRASRLSGGLASLQQAPEVYFYDQLGERFAARISGNLGNQVGRGGTEGVGLRGAGIDVLSPELREHAHPQSGHWLLGELKSEGCPAIEFILQQGVPSSLVGNYAIGNYFAIQQSPYADRGLVETLSLRPSGASPPSASLVAMRVRDARHRFLGEPESTSFQRSLLNRFGGFAATCPINYGWRAEGGVSLPGLLRGTGSFLGMVADKLRLDEGLLGGVVDRSGLLHLHDFHRSARWLRRDLREFTCDTLTSRTVRETGIFDMKALALVIEEHFTRRKNHHESVTFALDVALAQKLFCSVESRSTTFQAA
jgi:hypothetical protein